MLLEWVFTITPLPITSSIVVNVAEGKPKTRYILAVDDSSNTLKEVVKAISTSLGTGRIQHISKEDALLNKDFTVTNALS